MTDEMPMGASIPFYSTNEDDNHRYQTLFDDHPKGAVVSASPHLLLRMRIEKGEVL